MKHMSSYSRFLLVFALGLFAVLAVPAPSFAQVAVGVSVGFGPPELPVYEQPVCPGDGYLWTPGYWDYSGDDYFWVPGTWVMAPEAGFLWTPGYWGWGGSGFLFTAGYWGPVVGFYGGINYGFGYFGHGFEGGRWDGGHFFYNQAVANVNVTVIHNTYNTRVTSITETRVSYNGGNGGVSARATAQEEAAGRERHTGPVAAQTQHVEEARNNRELRAQVNHGAPPVAATQKPGAFTGEGVTKTTRAGAVHEPTPAERAASTEARPSNEAARPENNAARPENNEAAANAKPVVHPNDLPAHERPAAPNTGDANQDRKYQQQQDKLAAQQQKERQNLQNQQDKEHAQLTKQRAADTQKQQVEQKHQQQTQELQQRHTAQTQNLQQRQQPIAHAAPAPSRPPKQ
jgi:hypothetical protein